MPDKATERVLEILDEINAVPRQSHHLEKIQPWLLEWGRSRGFAVETDDVRDRPDAPEGNPHTRDRVLRAQRLAPQS